MFDPGDPAVVADPYPVLAGLREQGPVQWHDGLGMHLALTHAACDAVLRDRALGRIWRDRQPAEAFPAFNMLHRTSLLENEPPTHTRLRRLVAGAFGRGHVERMRGTVQDVADRLVGGLEERLRSGGEPGDLLAAVAQPLPLEVIADLLGVPGPERPLLVPWSNTIVKMYEYGLPADGERAAERAAAEFVAYLRDLVAVRRRTPREGDLVSDLIAAADEGDRLSDDEVVGTCALLLMAGHEATVNVVGNGVHALLRTPGEWRRVVEDERLVAPATEEMIRFDAPLHLFERTATADVAVAGTVVRAGEKVAALLGAANRDPAVFPDPDRFDAGRMPNPHLGFGAGLHFCLGAPLARLEVQSAVGALRRRLPDLALAGNPPRRPEFVIRGFTRLDVTVTGSEDAGSERYLS